MQAAKITGIKSDDAIEKAKKITRLADPHYEHNDCIRIAYEWLDAQKKIKNPTTKRWTLKHLIEKWAGRYVSTSDVEVAANMHPNIHGKYPNFNISARLTEPSTDRLKNISEAFKHNYREQHDSSIYKIHE